MSPTERLSPTDATTFGKYLLLGQIGKGGMAEVFLARPEQQRRLVAIKVIRRSLTRDRQFVDMFVREANLAIKLNHDTIVKTFEIGRVQGRHFICMEYISGVDLSYFLKGLQRSARRRLPIPHALSIALRLCEGLAYAHALADERGAPLNLVNRDVSPSNIRLSYEGDVKLLDFGIAKAVSGLSSEIGVLKGKVAYMSPEQVRGLPLDHRSDIFSVGIVLHEMLTQQRLFRGESEFQMMDMVRRAEVRPPSASNPRIPPEVDHLVITALQKDLHRRYQSAAEMAAELRTVLSHYNLQRHELREFVREVCHEDYQREQETIGACLNVEAPSRSAKTTDEDYGELVMEYDPASSGARRPRTPLWLWLLLGSALLVLAAAVVVALTLKRGAR